MTVKNPSQPDQSGRPPVLAPLVAGVVVIKAFAGIKGETAAALPTSEVIPDDTEDGTWRPASLALPAAPEPAPHAGGRSLSAGLPLDDAADDAVEDAIPDDEAHSPLPAGQAVVPPLAGDPAIADAFVVRDTGEPIESIVVSGGRPTGILSSPGGSDTGENPSPEDDVAAGDDPPPDDAGSDEPPGTTPVVSAPDDMAPGENGDDPGAGHTDPVVPVTVGDRHLHGSGGDDILLGGSGDDTIRGLEGDDTLAGGDGDDGLYGGSEDDRLHGGDGDDHLDGGSGDDRLDGGEAADQLFGLAGDDALVGGLGRDELSGNEGADRFILTDIAESTVQDPDRLLDFSALERDKLDVSGIDANSHTAEDEAFAFVEDDPFSGSAGELRFVNSQDTTYVYGDVDGNGEADFGLELLGVTSLGIDDIIL